MVTYNVLVGIVLALLVIFRKRIEWEHLAIGAAVALLIVPTAAGGPLTDLMEGIATEVSQAANALMQTA